jgi:myo-inositol-1(or 4)-monophosphatase
MYTAVRGQGAYCNDTRIKVSTQTLADKGCVLLYESFERNVAKLQALGGQVEPVGGAGFRASLLASGNVVGIVQGAEYTDFHDVGPASLIVEEAGGRVSDLSGNTLSYEKQLTNGIILSNKLVHDELLSLYN